MVLRRKFSCCIRSDADYADGVDYQIRLDQKEIIDIFRGACSDNAGSYEFFLSGIKETLAQICYVFSTTHDPGVEYKIGEQICQVFNNVLQDAIF